MILHMHPSIVNYTLTLIFLNILKYLAFDPYKLKKIKCEIILDDEYNEMICILFTSTIVLHFFTFLMSWYVWKD